MFENPSRTSIAASGDQMQEGTSVGTSVGIFASDAITAAERDDYGPRHPPAASLQAAIDELKK